MTGDADTIKVLAVIGTLFLLFFQVILYLLEDKSVSDNNKEVPMKNILLVIVSTTKAILSFTFNLGTNILASACLQA